MYILLQVTLTLLLISTPIYLHHTHRISLLTFKITIGFVCTIAFVLPVIFRCSLYLQRAVLYLNFVDRTSNEDLSHPERFDVGNARHLFVQNGNIALGVWHILPACLESSGYTEKEWNESLSLGYPVFVYVHGNIGTRATDHRLELYKILTTLDCHVVTFDYRSYGDSTNSRPHELALMEDGLAVYMWAWERSDRSPLFVWGHSLGTGLTTGLVARASQRLRAPKGVILEAPFDNMPSEIKVHPFGTVFRVLPWYNWLFSQPYESNNEDFNSSKYILEYPSPTLILHAEDDTIIPAKLGIKLYQVGKNKRRKSSGPVDIVIFKSFLQYGHKFICRAPEMPRIIENFVKRFKDKHFTVR